MGRIDIKQTFGGLIMFDFLFSLIPELISEYNFSVVFGLNICTPGVFLIDFDNAIVQANT